MYVKIFSTFTGDLVKTKKKNNLNLYFITHRIFFYFLFYFILFFLRICQTLLRVYEITPYNYR